jgi:ribosomal-protein-alanine N-acetyltransferase
VNLLLRSMRLTDISQVWQIEKQAFPTPWQPKTYAYEITESDHSHMVVLVNEGANPEDDSLTARLRRAIGLRSSTDRLLAYGGLWHLYDEAHISTIASHPDYRGQHYGEAALMAMLARAITLRASYVALEVRVTNLGAQALYRKHGFEVLGVKPRYYLDNLEDAFDMRLPLTDGLRARILTEYHALRARLSFRDIYSAAPPAGQDSPSS